MIAHRAPRVVASPSRDASIVQTGWFGEMTAYAKKIDFAVDALHEDIINDRCRPDIIRCNGKTGPQNVSDAFVTAWVRWIQDWRAFYNEHINTWMLDTNPGPQRDELDQWKAQLDDFEARFKKAGGTTTTPHLQDLPKPTEIPWTWIIVGTIAVGGGIILHSVGVL